MKAILLAAAVTTTILLTSPVAPADVGDLTYVGDAPMSIGRGLWIAGRTLSSRLIAPAPKGSGAAGAEVATLSGPSQKICVALHGDRARVDFTGEGRFADAPAVKRKGGIMSSFMNQTTFGPATVKTTVDGREVPVTVRIWDCRTYIPRGQQQRAVMLEMAVMAVGRCRFGEKVHAVRVIDTNHTLRLGDGARPGKAAGKPSGAAAAQWADRDLVEIDTHNEAFQQADIQVVCGQATQVGGKWYRLAVDAGGGKITATPVRIEVGEVLIPKGKWSALLLSDENHLILHGGNAPVAVPADTYTVMDYEEQVLGSGKTPHALTVARLGRKVVVKPGQTARLAIGSPLAGTVAVSQSKGTVRLDLKLTDVAGNSVGLSGPKGYPPQPNVTVLDARGREAHTATLKYG
ncbi:MAG: hypothetical protein WBF17_15205 [Phycisphaerae bacterium]